jgi:hypothetical protein
MPASIVWGGVYFETLEKSTGVPGQDDGTRTLKQYVSDSAIRIEAPDRITIVDINTLIMYDLDPTTKMYVPNDIKKIGNMTDVLGEQGGNLLNDLMNQINAKQQTVIATKETATIAGYKCRKYLVNHMMAQGEYWLSDQVEGVEELRKFGQTAAAALDQYPLFKQLNVYSIFGQLEGFPVKSITHIMGGVNETILVNSKRQKMDPALFTVPSDYKLSSYE